MKNPEETPKEFEHIAPKSLNVGVEHEVTANDNMRDLPELIPDDIRYFGADDENLEVRMAIMKEHAETGRKICDQHPGLRPYINGSICQPYFLSNDNEAIVGGHIYNVKWRPAA